MQGSRRLMAVPAQMPASENGVVFNRNALRLCPCGHTSTSGIRVFEESAGC